MTIKLKPLIISFLVALGGGGIVAFLTRNSMSIYDEINTPSFAPPAILFPIVWTILYSLMAISAYMIYESSSIIKNKALKVYGVQLFINFLWPILFFNAKEFFVSFLFLVVLWCMVFWMITLFLKIKPLSGYLQIPYLLWLTFAAYLNFQIYILN